MERKIHLQLLFTLLTIILGFGVVTGAVEAATVGPNNAGSISGSSWTSPSSASSSNNSYAEWDQVSGSTTSTLRATNFGFSIPTDAAITGIDVRIERKSSGIYNDGYNDQGVSDNTVQLVKSGSATGNNKAVGGFWSASDTVVTYGGSSDLWGTTWTPAQINASNFGVDFRANSTWNISGADVFIDAMRITVYYTSPPIIISGPTISYSGYTRTGPSNNYYNVNFTATDAEQTGANALTYYVHTGANRTGTQVSTGTFTQGSSTDKSIAYNASGMVAGTNTLYFSAYDGTGYSSYNPAFTVYRDDSNPSASGISHNPDPVTSTNQYTTTFTVSDTYSTNTNEQSWWIRTASGGGGTQLAGGAATAGNQVTTGTITDAALTNGATRYIRICDGAGNCSDTSFTVAKSSAPTISSPPTQTNKTSSSITLGGNITSQGGSAVDVRGVCYAITTTNANPEHGGTGVTCANHASGGTGIFTVDVTGLSASEGYSYKAFAHNTQGYAYTSADTFTTYGPPTVTTSLASSITSTQASLNSIVNPNGMSTNISYLWGTQAGVDCELQPNTLAGPIGQTGASNISPNATTFGSLGSNTTYYFCVTATNTYGTSYGSVLQFNTLTSNPSSYTYMDAGSALGGATDCYDTSSAPCPPTSVSATGVSQTQVNVSWSASTGPSATSYTITFCGTNASCSTSEGSQSTAGTSASDGNGSCGQTRYFKVYATNANGNSADSSIFSGTTSTCGPVFTIVNSNNGYGTDIAMGSDGYARIAYQDALDNSLKFVQCTNAACTTKNITTVDSIGYHISMKLGSDGFARIAYWDSVNDDLKFVQCTNAACTTKNITTVDSTGATGMSPKVDIGSDGYARIAYQYYSSPNVSIKFVQCTNAACTTKNISTVDTVISSGTDTGMALGSDGYARISYRNPVVGLRFVQCTNASCSSKSTTTIDSDGNLGAAFLSVEKGSDGFMRIGVSDGTIIKFIQCTNAACTTNANNTVYSDSGILYGSMKLGSDGYGRIGYYQSVSQDVKFIQCTNATCTTKNITTVDSTGNTGQGLSFTIGSDGFARIAYRDDLANLKLAICQSASCQ